MTPLTQSLASLAHKRQITRSVASVVRAEMAAIMAARQAGLSYEQICMGLRALGLDVSARTLRQTFYRIQAETPADAASGANTRSVASLDLPFGLAEAPAPLQPAEHPRASSFSIPLVEPVRQQLDALPKPPSPACPTSTTVPASADTATHGTGAYAAPGGKRFDPNLIREIQNSTPDLDRLADRYRQRLAAERAAQRTNPGSASARSSPPSPGTTTPVTTPRRADPPTT